MEKIKVFHIISRLDLGGAERVALNIAHSNNQDFEYHVVEVFRGHSSLTIELLKEMQSAGIVYHRSPIPVLISFHYLFERISAFLFPLWFIFVFKKFHPAIIHSHTDIPDLATYCFFWLFPDKLKTCKVVRTIHNTKLWIGMKRFGIKIEQFMQQQQANIAISTSVLDYYQKNYGEKPPIIYNGVIIPLNVKQYEYLQDDKLNILFAGRFETQKGIIHLIKIIKLLASDKRFFFHLVGDGSLKGLLIEGLTGCPNVKIQPTIYGLSKYLNSFDYLLMPSEHEGLSMLSIEASFSKLPVIINDCPGLNDTLPNDWPLKVENNDIAAYMEIFQKKIFQLNKKELAEKAHTWVKQNFTIEKMQANYEIVYRKYTVRKQSASQAY